MLTSVTISAAAPDAPALAVVKLLGRKHSDTLGFFPAGAFEEHAERGRLLVAEVDGGSLAGYCAFRISKGRAMIAHLCVADEFRKRGIASALCDRVKAIARERDLRGVGLHCRRDYPAYGMWAKLGFIPRGSKPGRGTDVADLTFWWFDLHAKDLFSEIEEPGDRLVAVMDCNVFRDLHDSGEDRNLEAAFLRSDWLEGQLELCTVDELFVEIDRLPLASPREQWIRDARLYRELTYDSGQFDDIAQELRALFGYKATTPRQESDIGHIAKAAAGKADVLLTRDGEVLGHRAEIEKRYGLRVLRPVDLISSLDEAEHAAIYQPARFAGTDILKARPKAEDVEKLSSAFNAAPEMEKREQFGARLRAILCDPRVHEVLTASSDGMPLFLFATKNLDSGVEVPLLRMTRGPLPATSLRHALLTLVAQAASARAGRLHVSDPLISSGVKAMLFELGFRHSDTGWQKDTLRFVGNAAQLTVVDAGAGNFAANGLERALDFEATHWPAKILSEGIPTWIVPIQPGWATQLFETKFASEFLLPPNRDLILSRENVYYSGAIQSGMEGRGRILWYVSGDPKQAGSKSIRGCSRLLEVRRGPAKTLFNEFRRIGVFEWRNIFEMTEGDPMKEILALRFADTELFDEPVDYSATRELGIRHNFASPLRIDDVLFAEIYRRGTRQATGP